MVRPQLADNELVRPAAAQSGNDRPGQRRPPLTLDDLAEITTIVLTAQTRRSAMATREVQDREAGPISRHAPAASDPRSERTSMSSGRHIVFIAWRDLANKDAGGSELLVDRLAQGLTESAVMPWVHRDNLF